MIEYLNNYFVECCDFDRYRQSKRCYHNWEEGISCDENEIEPQPIIYKKQEINTYQVCEGFDLYTIKEVHYLSGYSMNELEEYKERITSSLTEEESEECGYVPPEPIYSSTTEIETACTADYTKITITITKHYSGYNGTDWVLFDTIESREYLPNCEECGYVPPTPIEPIFSSTTETLNTCIGYDYYKITTTRYFSGYSEDEMEEYSASTTNELIEQNSTHCGYEPPTPDVIYSSYTETTDDCKGYDWYEFETTHYLSGYSMDELEEYNTETIERLIEENSVEHCGYEPPYSCYIVVDYLDGSSKILTSRMPCPYFLIEDLKKNLTFSSVTYYNCIAHEQQYIDCTNLKNVVFNNGSADDYTFSGCTNLESVIFQGTEECHIKQWCFKNCTSLNYVKLQKNTTDIDAYAFESSSLTELYYDGNKEDWYNIQLGIRWSGNINVVHCLDGDIQIQTKLIYTDGTESRYKFINNIIPSRWLSGRTDIEEVEIGYYITEISSYSIYDGNNLTKVTIPYSVKKFDGYIFGFCWDLEQIDYIGTIEEWNTIEKNGNFQLGCPKLKIVHCLDGDIPIS